MLSGDYINFKLLTGLSRAQATLLAIFPNTASTTILFEGELFPQSRSH